MQDEVKELKDKIQTNAFNYAEERAHDNVLFGYLLSLTNDAIDSLDTNHLRVTMHRLLLMRLELKKRIRNNNPKQS